MNIPHYLPGATDWMNSSRGTMPQDIPSRLSWIPPHAEPISNHALWLANQGLNQNPYGHSGVAPTLPISFAPMTGPVDASQITVPPVGYQVARDPLTGHVLLLPSASIDMMERTRGWTHFANSAASQNSAYLSHAVHYQQMMAEQELAHLASQQQPHSCFARSSLEIFSNYAQTSTKSSHSITKDPNSSLSYERIKKSAEAVIKCDIKQECIPASDQSFECVSDSSEIAKSTVDAKMNCGRPIPVDHDTSLNVDGTDQLCCESELQVKNEVDVEKIGSDVAHRKDEEICVDESSNNHEIEKECDKIGSIVVDSILDVDTTEIEDDVEEKNVVKTEVETDKDVVEEKRVCDHESGEANLIGRVEEHGEKSDACNECEIHERKPVNEDEVAEEVNDVEKETPRSECDEIGEVNQQLPTLQVAECSGNSVPSECQPVVDFIDNHGLNLLLDSIEEFTNKEMPKLERQGDPLPLNVSSSDDDLAVPPLCSPVGAIIPPILSQTTSPNLSQVDTVSSSGLGLLCALAEQRFKEEIESVPKELIGGGSPNRCTASETDYNVPLLKREVSHHVTKHNATQHNLSPGRASPNGCPVDVMDPMELEMRLTMAELQRKYKEKQKELAKLKPKCDRNFHERLLKRGPGRPRKRLSFSSTKATPYGCTTDDNCLSDNVSSATKKPYKTFGFDTANDNVKIFPKKRSKNSGSAHDRSSSPDAFYGANQLQRSISNARKTSEETFEDNSGDGEEINDDYEPNNRKLFDDSCVPVLQKRKPGRPKKHSPKKTESATETIVAKKPKSQNLRKLQADDYEGDLKLTDDKSVNYDEDAWMRRRSERIFLNEPPNLFTCNNSGNTTSVSSQLAPVFHSTSYGSSNFASLLKNSSRSKNLHSTSKNLKRKACGTLNKPVIKKSKFSDKFSKHDNIFASLAENCKFRGDKNERYAGNDTNNNNDIQHASNRNADLVGRPSTPEPKSCAVTAEILKDQLRVLILMDGLFYAARIDAIEPPDVYGVISDGERGNRPHIYTQEEILKDSVLEVRPCSLIELHDGTRVCAYWSQQYRCLYPGTVIKSSSPSPLPNRTFVNVEFDDGDSGKIELDDIRLLPSDYPIVSVDPNPIMSGKRRRRVSGAEGLLSNERKNQAVQSNVEVSSATDAPNEEANSKESIEKKERTDEVNRQTFKKRKSKSRKSSKNLTSKQENDGDNARGDSNEQNNLTMPSCENYVDKSREKIKKKSRKKGDSKSKKKCCETKRRKHRRHKEKCHHRHHHRHKHHHKHKKHKHSNEKRKQNSASDSNAKIDDQQNIEELMLPPATTTDNCDLTVKVVANEQQQQLDTDSFDSSSLSTSGSLDSTTVSSQSSDEMASEDGIQDDSKETKEQIGKNAAKNRRKDRPSSVENRSKIAAFLPAKQLWRWSGKSFKRPGMKGKAKKEFYKAITRGKETIRVGDSAVFLSTGRPNLPFIGHIEMMWESWGGNMVVKVKWFYHPEETKGGTNLNELRGALYHSSHVDENDVQTISHKCEVVSLDVYQKCKEDSSKSTKFGSMYEPNDIYYLAGSYDPTTGVITMEPNVR
ncbi:TNRC18 (predicted) [Pycnogonum litorale]